MEGHLEGEDFDIQETFENLDRYARANLEEGAIFEYEGTSYEVDSYFVTEEGYLIRGSEVE